MRKSCFCLLICTTCGLSTPDATEWTPTYRIGYTFGPGDMPEWSQTPDFGRQVDVIAKCVADYSGKPYDLLSRLVIRFNSDYAECESRMTTGCAHKGMLYIGWADVTIVAPGLIWTSLKETELGHELTHLLNPDMSEDDVYWRGYDIMYDPACIP
jgi:hypothetical protein